MDTHYFENLSLQSISNEFFISQSYLSRLFKKNTGLSPMYYIAKRRIGEAQSLLVLSKTSITDIAISVGFNNSSHFNTQFKKMVGLSPLAYRKKYLLPNQETETDP